MRANRHSVVHTSFRRKSESREKQNTPFLSPSQSVRGREQAKQRSQGMPAEAGDSDDASDEFTFHRKNQLHPPLPSRRIRQLHQHPKRHKHWLHPRHPTRPHNQNRQRLPPRRHNHANQRHQTSQYRVPSRHDHPHRTRNQPQLLRPLRRGLPIQALTCLASAELFFKNVSRLKTEYTFPSYRSENENKLIGDLREGN